MPPSSLKTRISGVLCALTLLLVTVFSSQHRLLADNHILYVNDNATGINNGSSWTNAYTKLQDALVAATAGDEIWVAAGVYYPDEGGNAVAESSYMSFELISGVALYGGFAGTESAVSQRHVATNLTVLSSDIDQNDITDANHIVINAFDIVGSNAFHAVIAHGVNSSARLDGFVLTAGLANQSPTFCPEGCGGALFAVEGSPTLANLTVIGNRATYGGGMLFRGASSPTLTDSTFTQNYAEKFAGGLQTQEGAEITVTRVKFIENRASDVGGGARIVEVDAVLNDVTFQENASNTNGGGLYVVGGKVTINHALFERNLAQTSGGGIYAEGGALQIQNAQFEGNANNEGSGGGIYANGTTLDIRQSDFVGNIAYNSGGALLTTNDNPETTITLTDVTMTLNKTRQSRGGAFFQEGGKLRMARVVISRTVGYIVGGGAYLNGVNATMSNVQFLGNIVTDPGSDTTGSGGGMAMDQGALTASNLTFVGNKGSDVGTLYLAETTAQLYNITVAYNVARSSSPEEYYTEGILVDSSTLLLTNSVLWHEPGNPQVKSYGNSTVTKRFSLDAGADAPADGNGNITSQTSPFRAEPTPGDDGFGNNPDTEEDESANDFYGDLRLKSTAPAIDTGSNGDVPADLADVDGDSDVAEELPQDIIGAPREVRFVASASRVDMGAYEYQNAAPTLTMAGPFALDEGGSLALDATGSTVDGSLGGYAWDCSINGSTDVNEVSPNAGVCVYPDDGNYTLRLTLSDNLGATSTATTTVTVANVAPTYTVADNQSAVAGSAQSINLGSFADPGAEGVWNVTVNWGGETSEFTTDKTGTLPARSHTYATAGTFNVVVTISDGESDDTSSFQVEVSAPPPGAPVVTAPAAQQTAVGTQQLFNLGSFTDTGSSGPWQITVSWGDNSTNSAFEVTSSGQLPAQPHTYVEPGNYEVLISVSDGALLTTMTFNVTIDEQPQAEGATILLPFTRK